MGSRARVSGQHGREDVSSNSSSSNTMGCVHATTILTNEDFEFIAKNTALTKVQVESRYQNFLKLHPDGRISRKSFHSMMKECYPGADTEKLERHIFRMYDTNKDGHIDFREFMIVLYIMSNGTPEENLKQIFRVFDINNDGTVSQKELQRIVKDLFHLFKKDENTDKLNKDNLAEEAFKEMDANTDGKITQEEFIRACLDQESALSTMLALKVIDVFI